MKNKHTSGPWTFSVHGFNRIDITTNPYGAGVGKQIGEVYSEGHKPEAVANAELIAAAPDLLESCELALVAISRDVREGRCPSGVENALRRSIAKAKGQN